jgi:hypothetical protein
MHSADLRIVHLDNMSITEHTKAELLIVRVGAVLSEILAHLRLRIVPEV